MPSSISTPLAGLQSNPPVQPEKKPFAEADPHAMNPAQLPASVQVIDSHTAGEPTRCLIEFPFPLPDGNLIERLNILRSRYDHLRLALLNEPRGSEILVGAYLLPPAEPGSVCSVIFSNNTGYLGMCGHGLIGVVTTLAWLGRIQPGHHRFDTPAGSVEATLDPGGRVHCRNVPSYRYRHAVHLTLDDGRIVRGDIAWGGNWFFLVHDHPFRLELAEREALTTFTWAIRQALIRDGITGADGAEIDHIELCAAPHQPEHSARNFILCPGKAYDRSPCGTGTSARMACLAADRQLAPGVLWLQEGILGTVFEAFYTPDPDSPDRILPTISGTASITGELRFHFDAADPFRLGVPSC